MVATYEYDVVQQCSEGSCGSTALHYDCFATFYEHALQRVFEELAPFGGTLSHIMLANSHCAKKTNYHFKTNKLPVLMNKPYELLDLMLMIYFFGFLILWDYYTYTQRCMTTVPGY